MEDDVDIKSPGDEPKGFIQVAKLFAKSTFFGTGSSHTGNQSGKGGGDGKGETKGGETKSKGTAGFRAEKYELVTAGESLFRVCATNSYKWMSFM